MLKVNILTESAGCTKMSKITRPMTSADRINIHSNPIITWQPNRPRIYPSLSSVPQEVEWNVRLAENFDRILTYNIRPLVSTAPEVVEFVNLESTEKKDNPAQILKNYSLLKIKEPYNKNETKILSIVWWASVAFAATVGIIVIYGKVYPSFPLRNEN